LKPVAGFHACLALPTALHSSTNLPSATRNRS
jgi:hypothetical protein